jgi:nitrile hydratase
MNGPHDMGGFTRFGPIAPEADEPVFHADWERRAFALVLAMGATGSWNIDMSRAARESLSASDYWTSSYYRIWIEGLIRLLKEYRLVADEEVGDGRMRSAAKPVKVLKGAEVAAVLAKGGPANRPCERAQRFRVGDRVRARNINPATHTRLPRYVRGRAGEIVRVHGTHVFPDSSAQNRGEDPQWLYGVEFSAMELWGKDNPDKVCLDLWEPYLEAL